MTNQTNKEIENYIFGLETLCLEEFGRIPRPKNAIREMIDSHTKMVEERVRGELRFWVEERAEAMEKTSHCQKDNLCMAQQQRKAQNLLKDFDLFLQALKPE